MNGVLEARRSVNSDWMRALELTAPIAKTPARIFHGVLRGLSRRSSALQNFDGLFHVRVISGT